MWENRGHGNMETARTDIGEIHPEEELATKSCKPSHYLQSGPATLSERKELVLNGMLSDEELTVVMRFIRGGRLFRFSFDPSEEFTTSFHIPRSPKPLIHINST